MKKPIKHLLVWTWMDTLCWIDTELIDKYWVPHKPACDYKRSPFGEELEETPIQEWYSYKELKYEFGDKVICKKCIAELGILMKQYTNLLNE